MVVMWHCPQIEGLGIYSSVCSLAPFVPLFLEILSCCLAKSKFAVNPLLYVATISVLQGNLNLCFTSVCSCYVSLCELREDLKRVVHSHMHFPGVLVVLDALYIAPGLWLDPVWFCLALERFAKERSLLSYSATSVSINTTMMIILWAHYNQL
jgi:hypothetical protein